jgi:hypothetical protein
VLGDFPKDQRPFLPVLLERLHGPLEECVLSGIAKASIVNKKPLL